MPLYDGVMLRATLTEGKEWTQTEVDDGDEKR
jgi:hypothetical protein